MEPGDFSHGIQRPMPRLWTCIKSLVRPLGNADVTGAARGILSKTRMRALDFEPVTPLEKELMISHFRSLLLISDR